MVCLVDIWSKIMSKDWQQYFPTYHFDESKNRDIALEEYKACCKILESEERIFDNLKSYQ